MSQGRIPLLAGLLVLLLAVAWMAGVFDSEPSTLDLPQISVPGQKITGIEVLGASSYSLVREGGTWSLSEPVRATADSSAVQRLLDSLSDFELASLVSRNPERHGQYGVDSTSNRVEASWDGGSVVLRLSTQGPDYQSNYVRVNGGDAVYSSRKRITVETDIDRLRDRTLMPAGWAGVMMAAVTTPDERFEVRGAGDGWQMVRGDSPAEPADSVQVKRWLDRFSPLSADGFLPDVPPDSVRLQASHTVTLARADGSTVTLSVTERDGSLAALVEGSGEVARLYSTRLETLFPGSTSLLGN